jgi:methionyl-tRNA formyltransferase
MSVEIKHAPKIFKETCEIKWDQPSKKIVDFIRGLSPYPAAWTVLNGKTFKIFKGEASTVDSRHLTVDRGPFRTDNKTHLDIKTSDGWVAVLELQPEGKKRMTLSEFFRGNKL